MDPDNEEQKVWPPAPKSASVLGKGYVRPHFLVNSGVDPLLGFFGGFVCGLLLGFVGACVAEVIWERYTHWAYGPGHQPLSFVFWCIGVAVTLIPTRLLRRYSAFVKPYWYGSGLASLLMFSSVIITMW